MVKGTPSQEGETPRQVAAVTPRDVSPTTPQPRALVKALEDSLKDVKDDVRDIKSHRHSDFVTNMVIFSAGFVLLAGIIIAGYFRLDDKLERLSNSSVRVDTKLEDLLQRIPAIPTPPPKR